MSALHDPRADHSGVTWPKSHVAEHCDHIDLRNAMAPMNVLSTSHDADTNVEVSHDTKTNATDIMGCQCWCQWYHMTKQSYIIPDFNCLDLRNGMVTLMLLLA